MAISIAVDNSHRTCRDVIHDLLSNNYHVTPKELEFLCQKLARDFTKEHYYQTCMELIKNNLMRSRLDTNGCIHLV